MKVPEPDTVVEKTKDITENQKVFVETLFPDGTLSLRLKGEKGDTLLAAEVRRGEVIRIIKAAPGQELKTGDAVRVLAKFKFGDFKNGKSVAMFPVVWEVTKKE